MEMLRYCTWLSEAVPKGSLAVDRILERFETPEVFYEQVQAGAPTVDFLPPHLKRRILDTPLSAADAILNRCEQSGISAVCYLDDLYPKRLLDIDGVPPVLYYLGDLSGLDAQPSLGVVGKRKAADASVQTATTLCEQIAQAGICIVSGCAVGVDAGAHSGALAGNGRTIGVLGCGVDVNYPKPNAELKTRILQNGGALLSEQPPGTPGNKQNFPCRNRILAGLSDGVFVVEAPKRSGSLITARCALEQGKDVFCLIPLSFESWRYAGNVAFLRDGALPVYGAYDILYAYYKSHPDTMDMKTVLRALDADARETEPASETEKKQTAEPVDSPPREQPPDGVSEDATRVYNALGQTPVHLEQLAELTALSMPRLLSALTELELSGVLREHAGKQYTVR